MGKDFVLKQVTNQSFEKKRRQRNKRKKNANLISTIKKAQHTDMAAQGKSPNCPTKKFSQL